jgi:hypothetical protein
MNSINVNANTTYLTTQRDLFDSGMVAKIGAPAFTIWNAIKAHADFNTGQAFPGLRKLAQICGMGKSSAQRAVESLEKNNLVRVILPAGSRRGQTYIARERIEVKIGKVMVCTVVMDYVPAKLNKTISSIRSSLSDGRIDGSLVEIIPGDSFQVDAVSGKISRYVPHDEIVPPTARKSNVGRASAALKAARVINNGD